MNYGYVEEIENKDIVNSANNLEREAESAGNKIAEAFRAAIDCVEDLTEALESVADPIEKISNNLELVAQVDFGEMANDLSDVSDILTDVLEKLCETDWIGIAGLIMQAFSQGFEVFTWLDSKDLSGLFGDVSINPIKTEVLSSNVLGAAHFAGGLEESTKETGLLSAGFNQLRETLDGVNLSQVAATAAQWAQTAAVTAWNGICGAASAVTTAFGAAMNFLTSPIGLVILGITALIAIIVLLVANWDTVTAALASFDAWLTGVFAINWTQQFGAFGEILNAFFANVENIWNAVKMIFTGIVEFVKGVFAGDWQKGHQREAVCFRKHCKKGNASESGRFKAPSRWLEKGLRGDAYVGMKRRYIFLTEKANI